MYDGGKIITGIIIGLALLTFPFWYNLGKAAPDHEPILPKKEKKCVEPTPYMKRKHMQLLDLWRDSVVRAEKRAYVAFDGRRYDMSLQNTCMSKNCHAKKTEFCDKCHDFAAVVPYCWDCHIEPKEEEPKKKPEVKH